MTTFRWGDTESDFPCWWSFRVVYLRCERCGIQIPDTSKHICDDLRTDVWPDGAK